ncbi:Uncharacterised protein [Serratia fonticola]|nr:Uncharacterised protein [Serratia fonticola]
MQNEPYFYNPGMTPEQLEDWLGQQKSHLSYYNQLVSERAALTARLSEVDAVLERYATSLKPEKLSFPWEPSPLLEVPQN